MLTAVSLANKTSSLRGAVMIMMPACDQDIRRFDSQNDSHMTTGQNVHTRVFFS